MEHEGSEAGGTHAHDGEVKAAERVSCRPVGKRELVENELLLSRADHRCIAPQQLCFYVFLTPASELHPLMWVRVFEEPHFKVQRCEEQS